MLNIPNPLNVPSDVLLRELCEHVPAPIRDTLEAWHDAAETIKEQLYEACNEADEAAREELEPYRDAWQELFDVWEDACASGFWPAESPDDGHLLQVMSGDICRGAEAVQAVRGALAAISNGADADPAALVAELRDILAAVELDD